MVSFESVSLHVRDVERSVAFYSKLPGAELALHFPGRFAEFKFGDAYVQVVAVAPGEQSFHIEMNAPDLQALYHELKAAGLEPDTPPTLQSFGRTNFQIHDPDGYVLEFDTPS